MPTRNSVIERCSRGYNGAIERTHGFIFRLKIRSAKADISIESDVYRDIGDI